MASLPPLPAPLGIHRSFMINQPVTLTIQDRSGGDITVQDQWGQDVVRCEGQFMSTRKRFISPRGEHLFDLRKDRLSLGPAHWYLESPQGEKIGYIDGHWTLARSKISIQFVNSIGDGSETTLQLRGDFNARDAGLTWNGCPVAIIRRQFGGAKQFFGNRQTYEAQVAPGADITFVAAIICSLNLSKKQQSTNTVAATLG